MVGVPTTDTTTAIDNQRAGTLTPGEPAAAIQPVIAAIPAFNEARFIGSVVLHARQFVDLVLVIDDGSTDQTAAIAEAAGAIVLRHETNTGKGGALNSAFTRARRLEARCLVLIDGDGQHRVEDISPDLGAWGIGIADGAI